MKKIVLIAVIAISTSFVISSCSNSSSAKNVTANNIDSSLIYSCTMHQEVIGYHPGECPKCGMTLVKQKMTGKQKKLFENGNYVKLKD